MANDRSFEVVLHHLFGELVKAWADGSKPQPKTVGELRQQLLTGVAVVGDGFLDKEPINLVNLPLSTDQISLVIPDPADLSMTLPAGDYPLPPFYELLAFKKKSVLLAKDKEKFRSSRIADYCTGKCM